MKEPEDISLYDLGEFCFLNGQSGLHQTEEAFYNYLVDRHFYPLVLDDLFNKPQSIGAIKYFNPSTIVIGTTGTYKAKIDMVMAEFVKLKWLPKNAIFTMGEGYFWDIIKQGVQGYKIYPYASYFKDAPVLRTLQDNDY